MKFTELTFDTKVIEGIEKAGFAQCTNVQEKVLPVGLTGKDLMVQSKTGSGKTAVYVLTILQNIAENINSGKNKPKALIVAPTRELAVQIESDAKLLASGFDNIVIGAFYGGVGYDRQEALLKKGCDICVGTPGRLLDFQKSRKLDFRDFDIFVLDEADRMFDMGFYPDVQKMFSLLSEKEKRQTMLFSATLSTKVRNLAWSFMNEPEEIEVQPEELCVKKITQELYHISKTEKFNLFLQLMAKENPENALIFTNTKAKAVELSKRLTLNGYVTKYLMGDMAQSKRLATINKMKEGKIKFLVATDVAARGLQIDDLQLVINYDIPEDFESYVHRIGRTARAGKTGKAITLACETYIYGLEPIEKYIGMKIPVIWPEEGELPKVEDKSKDLSFRDLVGDKRNSSKNNSKNRNSKPSRNKNSRKPNTQNSNNRKSKNTDNKYSKKDNKNRKSYEDMQKLSLEERLEYYKKQYGNTASKKPSKKKTKGPLQDGQKASKTFNKETKTVKVEKKKPEVKKQEIKEKPKKMGFFARLFKRNK